MKITKKVSVTIDIKQKVCTENCSFLCNGYCLLYDEELSLYIADFPHGCKKTIRQQFFYSGCRLPYSDRCQKCIKDFGV